MNQLPPGPGVRILLGPFQIFSKIGEDISISRCITVVVDTGSKWKKSSIRKVATSVADIGSKFAAVTPMVNLPPVSTTPAFLMEKFAAGVIDTGGAP